MPFAVGAGPFVRRPSEAVGDGFNGLGGPSYGIFKCAILSCERYILSSDADRSAEDLQKAANPSGMSWPRWSGD